MEKRPNDHSISSPRTAVLSAIKKYTLRGMVTGAMLTASPSR
jgi:hypothetical protein